MRYVVKNRIGESPIGEIFQGYDFQTQRKVAILQIDPHYLRAENYDANWGNLEKTFSMPYRSLQRVIDTDRESGRIILEERGQSMSDLFKGQNLRIPQRIVRSIIYDILVLLTKFREQGFIHGDIRSENLLLPVSPEMRERKLSPIRLAYSPGIYYGKEVIIARRKRKYMAPEMLNPQFGAISSATDLYCLAFCGLELIFGNDFDGLFNRIGPDGETHWAALHGNHGEQLPPLKTVFPGIDYDLHYFFHTVVFRNVVKRPRSSQMLFFEMKNRYILHQIQLHLHKEQVSQKQINAFYAFCNVTPLLELMNEQTGTRNPPEQNRIDFILGEVTKYLRKIAISDFVINSLADSVKPFVRPERYDVTLEIQDNLEHIESEYNPDRENLGMEFDTKFASGFQGKTSETGKTHAHRDELVSNLTGREVVEVPLAKPTLRETFLALFGKKK